MIPVQTVTRRTELVRKPIEMVWLEITPNCQLQCKHCYVSSLPGLGHGKLSLEGWQKIMVDLRTLGVKYVTIVGGEATTHPQFCEIFQFAAALGFSIEVYTNMVGISDRMWDLFVSFKPRLATSFYTVDPLLHAKITGSATERKPRGSYDKTLNNIKKAIQLGLRLRVGMVHVDEAQNIPATKAFLESLGIKKVRSDRARGVGRGAEIVNESPISALCGKCIGGKVAITASGDVYPCIMARSFPYGNVLEQNISTILSGQRFKAVHDTLFQAFQARAVSVRDCPPDEEPCPPDCDPECDPKEWPDCPPDCCPETIADCEPTEDEPDPDE